MAQFRDVTLPYLKRITDPEAFDIGRELATAMAVGASLAGTRLAARGQALAQINAGREMDLMEQKQREDLQLAREALDLDADNFELSRKHGQLKFRLDKERNRLEGRRLEILEQEAEREAAINRRYLETIDEATRAMDIAPQSGFEFDSGAILQLEGVGSEESGSVKKKALTSSSGNTEQHFKKLVGKNCTSGFCGAAVGEQFGLNEEGIFSAPKLYDAGSKSGVKAWAGSGNSPMTTGFDLEADMAANDRFLIFATGSGSADHGAQKVSGVLNKGTIDGHPWVEVEAVGAYQGQGKTYTNRKRKLTTAPGYTGQNGYYTLLRVHDTSTLDING